MIKPTVEHCARYGDVLLPVVEARLDWITCTAPRGAQAEALYDYGMSAIAEARSHGDRIDAWGAQGYRGWQCGSIRTGLRKTGAMLVVSGIDADRLGSTLATMAQHWSRVDYCVTVYDETMQLNPPDEYWRSWLWRANPITAPVALTMIRQMGEGGSLFVGQRSSARYFRVYDKHAEAPNEYPLGCWRFELELKREASEAEHREWQDRRQAHEDVCKRLASYLARYGLLAPFRGSVGPSDVVRPHRERDADRILRWLEEQVAPAVAFAAEARGELKVIRAIGLNHAFKGVINFGPEQ